MSTVLGIDFGTTYSSSAAWHQGKVCMIPNPEGTWLTPSVVAISKTGERLVGQSAQHYATLHPENSIFSIKRLLGRRYQELSFERQQIPYQLKAAEQGFLRVGIGDHYFSPTEIVAILFENLKLQAEKFLGTTISQTVVTIPTGFTEVQRQTILDSGQKAGMKVLRLIHDPTAAVLAYEPRTNPSGPILVIDWGGGTLDVSILDVRDGVIDVKATRGDAECGGDDFDLLLLDELKEEIQRVSRGELRLDRKAWHQMRGDLEGAKNTLASKANVTMDLSRWVSTAESTTDMQVTLSSSRILQRAQPLRQRLHDLVQQVLADAQLRPSQIQHVQLEGGMIRSLQVAEILYPIFPVVPPPEPHSHERLARGAALQGGILIGDIQHQGLFDITPLSLGIETVGGIATPIIPRNTRIPTRRSQIFSTALDNQNTVSIRVLQGESELADHNRTLGRFNLTGILPAPRGIPQIEVIFNIDANGMVQVLAKDTGSGQEQKIIVTVEAGLNSDEVDALVKQAVLHRDDDTNARHRIERINHGELLAYQTEKILEEHGSKVDALTRGHVQRAIEKLKLALAQGESEAIEKACKAVERMAHKFSEAIYLQSLSKTPESNS
jgi:molecular chaperone DnaK